MKVQSLAVLALAAGLAAGAVLPVFAQAERIKAKAKDLKKQVETTNTFKTNAPAKPAQR
jgi:uncharacterized protein HemX